MEYHPYILASYQDLQDFQAKHGIIFESYGPLTPVLQHPSGGPLKRILTKIAHRLSEETGQSVNQSMILYLWTMGKGVVAITACTQESNVQKIALVQGLRDLKREELEEIDQVDKSIYFRHYVSVLVLKLVEERRSE